MSDSESPAEQQLGAEAVREVAVLGAGVIGQSWTALFLAAGKSVAVYDPDPAAPDRVRGYVEQAWPTLESLGLTTIGDPGLVSFHDETRAAVEGAQFVQENIPEQVALKHRLYAEIEPHLGATTVVASSASGLTLSELQSGWQRPDRLVLGHPFNPPHLIPLVEVLGNERTGLGVVERARDFYASVGKTTIELRREVPGHVANRLQAALWREAIHLILEGVASAEDVDTAVRTGPGLRWAAMGPTMLFHLGAGEGGLASFLDRYSDSFNRWWDDLGHPHLDEATRTRLVTAFGETPGGSHAELAAVRDARISAILEATAARRGDGPTGDAETVEG